MSGNGAGRSCSPTGGTWRLLAILAAMIYAAASQNNGPAYLLAFGLVAMGAVGLLHGWRNLADVKVRVIEVLPAYAPCDFSQTETDRDRYGSRPTGLPEQVRIRLAIRHSGKSGGCYGVTLLLPGLETLSAPELPPLAPGEACEVMVTLAPLPRGFYQFGEIVLTSLFPFGFLRVTQRCRIGEREFPVYPCPLGGTALPLVPGFDESTGGGGGRGDDFIGLRHYQPGESQRHVDWKAVARGHVMQVKQFGGDALRVSLLDWQSLSGEVEWKLSRVASWLLEKEKAGERYGLSFPGEAPTLGQGPAHLLGLLETLARYPGGPKISRAKRGGAAQGRWAFLRNLFRVQGKENA